MTAALRQPPVLAAALIDWCAGVASRRLKQPPRTSECTPLRRTSGWETILFVTEESQPWKWPPGTADEATILLGFLERQRALLELKTSDLDAAGMQATFGASAITLGGLLKHLAHSEYHWFSTYLTGDEPQPPWEAPESWGEDWHTATNESPDQLRGLWQDSVARSRSTIARQVASDGLDAASRPPWDEGIGSPNLRWIVCHMIEEYARHLGHADLLRESIDGAVGEEPGSD